MAKKDKKPAESGADGAGAPKAGKKKLVIIASVVALLAAGGGGGWYWMTRPTAEQLAAEAAKAAANRPASFVEMRDMMIGMSAPNPQQERQPVMKIKVVLEVADPKISDQIKPLLPRVEDAFQVFMRELRPSDLEGSAGIYRLKEELLRRVNLTVHPARVDAVLFKELLVQ